MFRLSARPVVFVAPDLFYGSRSHLCWYDAFCKVARAKQLVCDDIGALDAQTLTVEWQAGGVGNR